MPITVGTHRNGERFARVYLSERGISATVEGKGRDDDEATSNLRLLLIELSQIAEEAAVSMTIDGDN